MSRPNRQFPDASRTPRSREWLSRCFAFAILSAGSLADRAGAQEVHGYALNWVRAQSAETCIASSELAGRVEQLIGPVFRAPDAADRAIEGLIAPDTEHTGWRVQLRMLDRAGIVLGERSFATKAAACTALNDPILLVVALMIDPSASERGLPPELLSLLADGATEGPDLLADLARERQQRSPPAERTAEPTSRVVPTSKPKPAPGATTDATPPRTAPRARSVGIELALTPQLSYAIQPHVAPGIALLARKRLWASLSLELGFSQWLSSDVARLDPASGNTLTAEFSAAGANLSPCLAIARFGRAALTACAGAALIARSCTSNAIGGFDEKTHFSVGPYAGIDARYTISDRLFALLGVGTLAMVGHRSYSYSDWTGKAHRIYEPAAVGAWALLGLGVLL